MLSYSCVTIHQTAIFEYLPAFNQEHLGIHYLREGGTMLRPLLHLSMLLAKILWGMDRTDTPNLDTPVTRRPSFTHCVDTLKAQR